MDLIAYARVSKAKNGQTVSVDNQFRQIDEWATKNHHTIVARYEDRAVSATKDVPRPGFEALMANGHKNIVVWNADRMFRRPRDLEDVVNKELTIYQVIAGPFDLTTPQGRLMARQMVAFAAYEIEQKNQRVAVGFQNKAQEGKYLGRHRPFGQEKDGTWVQPEADAVIQAAKDLVNGDSSFYRIAKKWNEAGLFTPVNGSRGGNPWNANSVRVFFTSPRLKGYQKYKNKILPLSDWEALMSEEIWEQIQSIIESKKTGKASGYTGKDSRRLLSGLLECGKCGGRISSSIRTQKGQDRENRIIYRCTATGHNQAKALDVEAAVRDDALRLLSRRDDAEGEAAEHQRKLADLAHEIRAKEVAWEDWSRKAAARLDDVDLIAEARQATEEELDRMRGELATLQAQTAPNLFTAGGWESASKIKRRNLLDSLYSSITLLPAQQGKKFTDDRLDFHYTEFALEMARRYVEDNTVTPEELMGRTVGPNVERKTTPGNFNPNDPWEGAEEVKSDLL